MTIQKTLFGQQYCAEEIDKVRLLALQQEDMDYRHSAWILNRAADKMEMGQELTRDEMFEVELYGAIL